MADTAPKMVEPPKSSTRERKDTPPRTSTQRGNAGKIQEGLDKTLSGISVAFAAAGNDVCAVIISERGSEVSAAWAELARTNKSVEKVLLRMIEGSAWTGVVVSTAGMVIPIAQYYNVVPAMPFNPFGLRPEEVMKIQRMQEARAGTATPNGNGADSTN